MEYSGNIFHNFENSGEDNNRNRTRRRYQTQEVDTEVDSRDEKKRRVNDGNEDGNTNSNRRALQFNYENQRKRNRTSPTNTEEENDTIWDTNVQRVHATDQARNIARDFMVLPDMEQDECRFDGLMVKQMTTCNEGGLVWAAMRQAREAGNRRKVFINQRLYEAQRNGTFCMVIKNTGDNKFPGVGFNLGGARMFLEDMELMNNLNDAACSSFPNYHLFTSKNPPQCPMCLRTQSHIDNVIGICLNMHWVCSLCAPQINDRGFICPRCESPHIAPTEVTTRTLQ